MHRFTSLARPLAMALATVALAACVTPTVFGPADSRGFGYREQRIEDDRFIVTFAGNSATSQDQVADAALRRAAELTLQEGYDWFEVVQRTDNVGGGSRSYGGSGVSVGVGGVSGSRGSSVGTSVGLSFPLGGSGVESTTSLEVRLGRGERPARASVYDAQAVARNLAAASGGAPAP
jgi:flavin-binding protein dodecin